MSARCQQQTRIAQQQNARQGGLIEDKDNTVEERTDLLEAGFGDRVLRDLQRLLVRVDAAEDVGKRDRLALALSSITN